MKIFKFMGWVFLGFIYLILIEVAPTNVALTFIGVVAGARLLKFGIKKLVRISKIKRGII